MPRAEAWPFSSQTPFRWMTDARGEGATVLYAPSINEARNRVNTQKDPLLSRAAFRVRRVASAGRRALPSPGVSPIDQERVGAAPESCPARSATLEAGSID